MGGVRGDPSVRGVLGVDGVGGVAGVGGVRIFCLLLLFFLCRGLKKSDSVFMLLYLLSFGCCLLWMQNRVE